MNSPFTSLFRRFPAATATAAPSPMTQQVRTMARKAKGKGAPAGDARVRMIRYFLFHPATHTPRPLRFGTMRMLRHWTIHRAWLIFRRNERTARRNELQRQHDKIREACNELANTDIRLYRVAVAKDVGTFPIELRIPTDTPPRNGWNHAWKRN